MKKLALLAFLILGLTTTAKVLQVYGGEETFLGLDRSRLDAQMLGTDPLNFGWHPEFISEHEEKVTLCAETQKDLSTIVEIFRKYGFKFNDFEYCKGGVLAEGYMYGERPKEPFFVLMDTKEEFYVGPEGYYLDVSE